MAFAVMAASFLNFYAGLSGFVAALIATVTASVAGFDRTQLRSGVYSFNALITGIGLGTFFDPGSVFFVLLVLTSLLTLIISVAMGGWLFRHGLPFLSLPFVFTFWVILLPSSELSNLGLTQRNIFWINELYSIGGNSLLTLYQQIESIKPGVMVEIYLRSLSSVFFQDTIIAGIIIALGLLIASRIFFLLSIIGFLSAYLFAIFAGSEASSITYYNIGANFIMVAIAIGGFFVIPSRASYLWTLVLVPLTSLVLLFFTKLLTYIQLPVFSMPYSIITILFIHFLQQRGSASKLHLTPIQQYSPEKNLYSFRTNQQRLTRFQYIALQLPFWGEWSVTQGYNGQYTHKDAWGNALDFMILDEEGRSYQNDGLFCNQYHCYGKAITSPADGVITDCQDGIDDNEIGQVNTLQNWGNSIVIQHAPQVYTQLSHLRKNSIKVKKGEFVRAGDVIAQCGNSGRSPYPHLHFQVQAQPFIGARTIEYPLAYFTEKLPGSQEAVLQQFSTPTEGSSISNLQPGNLLYHAFNILPDTNLCFSFSDGSGKVKTEHWDSYTDAYNYKYLYCRETGSIAYYTCDKLMFYFTAFYGSKKSMLYNFFLAASKILLSNQYKPVSDTIPLHLVPVNHFLKSINDLVAPFYNLLRVEFRQSTKSNGLTTEPQQLELSSELTVSLFRKKLFQQSHRIQIDTNGLSSFTIYSGKSTLHAENIS